MNLSFALLGKLKDKHKRDEHKRDKSVAEQFLLNNFHCTPISTIEYTINSLPSALMQC